MSEGLSPLVFICGFLLTTSTILLFQLLRIRKYFNILLKYLIRNRENPQTRPHDLSKFSAPYSSPFQECSVLIENLSKDFYLANKLEKRHLRDRSQLLENIDMGILALLTSEKIIFLNQQLADYGITNKNAIQPVLEESSLDKVIEDISLKNLLKNNLNEKSSLNEYFSLANKREFIINNSPLKNSKNEHIGMVFFIKNFDDKEDFSKLKKQFLSNLSHQIKTPLTNILGYMEILQDSKDLDEASKNKFINIAYEQTNELKELTEQMLLLSKIDSVSAEEFKKTNSRIESIIHDAIELYQIQASEKNIELNYKHQATHFKNVLVNRPLLREALGNIISNAIKYSPPQSSVEIMSTINEQKTLEITIQDFGHGISSDEKDMIFQRFYRAPKAYLSNFEKGFGLGLPIANKIVKIHGEQT